MSIAQLYNIPRSQQDLSEWTFANATSHVLIVAALRTQKRAVGLEVFALDPVPQADYANFLRRHQVMHNQMDALLKIGGNDFTDLNFEDPTSLDFLWFLHANEHILAHRALRINN